MKKVALNLIVLLIFLCSTTFAQLTISVVGSNDVCVGSGVNLIVNNPNPNYNYTWWVDDYTCGVASSAFTYGYGPNILVYGTGTFHCEALASGLPPLFSQNLSVRVLPGSFGSTLLPLPYSSSTVTCTTSVNLCIPNAFYQNFPGTILKWYKNGIEIPGATGSGYTATTDGFYKYSVTSSCITAYSDSVEFISASAIPSFTTTAVSPVCNGNTINFSATNPVAGAVYTWQTSNFPSSGFTASGSGPNFSYIVPSALNLYVRLQRVIPGCSVQITPAVGYTIQNISRQISPFATQNICTGDSVTLTINITGGPATLQWMKNGIPIPGATGTSYKASSSGVYRVDVTSACGVSYSNDVTVVVHSYPTVVINAASATTFCAGGSVNLNANAGPGLTYQWKKYGNPIAGATSPNYT
ncbi:MAG TPA: hypothetical protein PKD91_09375, partial [Bacteroidia bacterium]|nr:hypothetical protein [Bacteroidia bacterium]